MSENFEIPPPSEDIKPMRSEPSVPAKPFPVWSGWDVLLLFFFTGFIALFVGALGEAVSHWLQVKFPTVQFLRHPAIESIFLLSFQALLDVLIFLFIYFTVTLKYSSPFWLSIKWVPRGTHYLLTYLSLGIFLALTVLVIEAFGRALPALAAATRVWRDLFPSAEDVYTQGLRFMKQNSAFLFAALGVFVAPFVEEVIFRGFIYPIVERKLGRILAVLATALLFTTVHVTQLWGSWSGIVLILLVGITLSTVRAKTDSLIPSFVIHLSYNSTICLLFLVGSLVKGFPT